jgi:hypothetical protein
MLLLTKPTDVLPRLEELELDYDRLREVVHYADGEAALCTANDPKGFDLVVMNARAARGLRNVFCGERWEADETGNQAGIRNPHIKVRVIHCNFDENTGTAADPTNLTEKGAASGSKVACNQTGWIPGLPVPGEDETDNEYATYVLGTYYDRDGEILRAELSRPRNFSGGRYKKFFERIVLLDGSEKAPVHPGRSEPTETIDIAVKRK